VSGLVDAAIPYASGSIPSALSLAASRSARRLKTASMFGEVPPGLDFRDIDLVSQDFQQQRQFARLVTRRVYEN